MSTGPTTRSSATDCWLTASIGDDWSLSFAASPVHRVVVDYPAQRSVNFASEALFRIKNSIERGTTRPFALYGRGEVARAFASAGFRVTEERPQFFLPMALYRLAGSTGLARGAEGLARSVGATALLGSPVIARADRGPDAVGSPRG